MTGGRDTLPAGPPAAGPNRPQPDPAAEIDRSLRAIQLLEQWRERAWDPAVGLFEERLTRRLEPIPGLDRRAMVAFRQLHLYSRASRWQPAFACVADELFVRTAELFWDRRHGGWCTAADPHGRTVTDRRKQLYTHAFALLGLAEYHRLRGAGAARALAEETFALLTRNGDPSTGFPEHVNEDWSPRAGRREQNPHMHLMEGCLALRAAGILTEDAAALARGLADLAERLHHRDGSIREYHHFGFSRPHAVHGAVIEPGHQFEWAWLLTTLDQAEGTQRFRSLARRLYDDGLHLGWDRTNGGVYDEVHCDGAVLRSTKRLWPLTELIKAARTMGDGESAGPGTSAQDRFLDEHYLLPGIGGWHERLSSGLLPIAPYLPTSSLYHLVPVLMTGLDWYRQEPAANRTLDSDRPAQPG